MSPGAVVGVDLAACLRLGDALGYDAIGLAELLPAAETGLVEGLNRRLSEAATKTPSR